MSIQDKINEIFNCPQVSNCNRDELEAKYVSCFNDCLVWKPILRGNNIIIYPFPRKPNTKTFKSVDLIKMAFFDPSIGASQCTRYAELVYFTDEGENIEVSFLFIENRDITYMVKETQALEVEQMQNVIYPSKVNVEVKLGTTTNVIFKYQYLVNDSQMLSILHNNKKIKN